MAEDDGKPAASGYERTRDGLDASWQGAGPKGARDFAETTCCDCNSFGPWGDGEYRYCEKHVPDDLKFAARAFEERKKRAAP